MRNPRNAPERVVHVLMQEKTRLLTQAQALGDLGMEEAAGLLWREIAGREEQIAPILEAMGQDREAAVHRVSAASSYEKVKEYARAANLYQAALAGPLLDTTRSEVKEMLARCLTSLVAPSAQVKASSRRGRKDVVAS